MKVLVLDNDIHKGNLIAESIKLTGVNVDVFDDYDQALKSGKLHRYDLLVPDICLGEKRNGSDFIKDYCNLYGDVAVEPYSANPSVVETMGYHVNEFDPKLFPAYLRSRIKQIQDNNILLDRIGPPMITSEKTRCNDCVTDAGRQLQEIRDGQKIQADALQRIEKALVGTLDNPGRLSKLDQRIDDLERKQKITEGWQAEKDLIIRNFIGKALLVVIPTIVVIFSALFALIKLFAK